MKTVVWKDGPAVQQDFAFPAPIMRYIAMNPSSPEVYQKLIQTCKYFFQTNPLIVADCMENNEVCNYDRGPVGERGKCYKIVFKQLVGKIWLTDGLSVTRKWLPRGQCRDKARKPQISRMFYSQCIIANVKKVCIMGNRLTIQELQYLVGNASKAYLCETRIIDGYGNATKLDQIIEVLPKIEDLAIYVNDEKGYRDIIDEESVANLLKMEHLENCKQIVVRNFHLNIDVVIIKTLLEALPMTGRFQIEFAKATEGVYDRLDGLAKYLIEHRVRNRFIAYGTNPYFFELRHLCNDFI